MAFVTLLSIAAYTDLRYRVIPNEVCLGILWLGFVLNSYADGMFGVGSSIVGTLLCLAIFLPGYAIGRLGAGDVKLMAACGCFLGPIAAVNAIVFTLLVGGIVAIGVLVGRSTIYFAPRLYALFPQSTAAAQSRIELPYGVAISVGAVLAMWFTPITLSTLGL
jgi:prepilin peptidase CpaA